ncbi:MAG: GGDEF domain-containing protein [Clostridiaceae bacterium]|nr:GGDEF domain-containing protein [Clostridiaceae bacterium]
MLFLNLENQLLLIIVLIFSFWLFVNSFAIKLQSLKTRAFGMAFIIPLIMTSASFLVSIYNKSNAISLFIISHVLLLLDCTFIMFINKSTDSFKLFYVIPYVLIPAGFYFSSMTIYPNLFWVIRFLLLVTLAINLVLLINITFQKEKDQMMGFAGLFILSFSTGLIVLSDFVSMEALLLMALGYICCTAYVYYNTLDKFFKEYKTSVESLKRINSSIQTEVIKRVEAIERSNKKLLEKSKTDNFTGLLIKTAIVEELERFIQRAPKSTISVLMIDIDKFKQINDTLGHQIGDRCIRSVTNLMKASFRQDDILGRYGGDEFMILLPDTAGVRAYLIADRFRELVQSKSKPEVTVSIGIANYPSDGQDVQSLIEAADKALYISKQKGRNTVTLYSNHNQI